MNHYQQGFTLLEILVVLILVSLLSTFLLQGISFMARAHIAISDQLVNLQQGKLQEAWFRQSVAATVVQLEEDKTQPLFFRQDAFKGSKQTFSGLTLAPLNGQPGILSRYGWQLRADADRTFLEYQSVDKKVISVAWWHADFGQFKYLDQEHQWHNQWPPAIAKDHAQLPEGIVLLFKRKNNPVSWFQELQTQKTPPPVVQEYY